ncbi:MAG: pyridoxine 5'-phosphate synthase [Flavobacteriales bacterium]|nr:pyridoxine 5'-phosphate synthase [Flavobacteriales bacterium]
MTRLSVNINKLATLRNARGGQNPDLVQWAIRIQEFGAEGITIHPRPDERHIRRDDVRMLKEAVYKEYNIEGYPSREFLDMVIDVKPDQVTFVPDPPDVLTSNAGWNAIEQKEFLKEAVSEMRSASIRTSIFMETDIEQIRAASETGTDRIELYTEDYATKMALGDKAVIESYRKAALCAKNNGMGVNAGHDLDLNNLNQLVAAIPWIDEVSIGHALVCDALKYGMENTINLYLRELRDSKS